MQPGVSVGPLAEIDSRAAGDLPGGQRQVQLLQPQDVIEIDASSGESRYGDRVQRHRCDAPVHLTARRVEGAGNDGAGVQFTVQSQRHAGRGPECGQVHGRKTRRQRRVSVAVDTAADVDGADGLIRAVPARQAQPERTGFQRFVPEGHAHGTVVRQREPFVADEELLKFERR